MASLKLILNFVQLILDLYKKEGGGGVKNLQIQSQSRTNMYIFFNKIIKMETEINKYNADLYRAPFSQHVQKNNVFNGFWKQATTGIVFMSSGSFFLNALEPQHENSQSQNLVLVLVRLSIEHLRSKTFSRSLCFLSHQI